MRDLPGIRFPIKSKIKSPDQKVFLLIQIFLGGLKPKEEGALMCALETKGIMNHASRIARGKYKFGIFLKLFIINSKK